jgi:ABC-type taurine transport system ATPase subunit
MDPPTPPHWTVRDYVEWSARLAGATGAEARVRATDALDALALGALAKSQLSRIVPHARRGAVVAAAIATTAEIVVLEDPLGGLADDVAASYGRLLVDGLGDRSFIVFAPRVDRASPLTLAADEAIVCTAARLEAQGTVAELAAADRRFALRVAGESGEGAGPLLEAKGARVISRDDGARDGTAHLVLDLGDRLTTGELVATCAAAGVSVVELYPLSRVFA